VITSVMKIKNITNKKCDVIDILSLFLGVAFFVFKLKMHSQSMSSDKGCQASAGNL
jgi:hypothetical protein